jgi:7-cyano-7-deazaguanine synthase in queuosine biosynthesis
MDIVCFVGHTECQAPQYLSKLAGNDCAVLDAVSADRNITLQFRCDEQLVNVPMLCDVRDLVSVAACVYVSDELVCREDQEDGWTRDFHFTVPVADVSRWSQSVLKLTRTLNFLSQDRFDFTFEERNSFVKSRKHRAQLPVGFDAVCLFSGGIDSLMGAYQLLKNGRKVLLVGHQAEAVTAKTQKEIASALITLFPGQASLVQCRLARSKNEKPSFDLPAKVEETHRPRSFLFLSLAVALARAAGIDELFMPENGLIALNAPLQLSRVGTHSTRTAHPVYLTRLGEFLHSTDIFQGSILNPFLYQSKTDMLRNVDQSLVPLLLRSVSCSHPSRYHDEGVRHCGYCVPCIYRRAAMAAANLDRSDDYAFDVFSNRGSIRKKLPLNSYKQADIRALVPFAKRILASTEAQLQSLILAHGYFPPEVGGKLGPFPTNDYRPWTDMLRRWASEFIQNVSTQCTIARRLEYGLPRNGKITS